MTDLTSVLGEPGASVAVIGATDHSGKYGGLIYRDLKRRGLRVFAVNPYRETVDGDPCWKSVLDLRDAEHRRFRDSGPSRFDVVDDCEHAGIFNIWLQPGAESPELMEKLDAGPFNWLAHACIMVRAGLIVGRRDVS